MDLTILLPILSHVREWLNLLQRNKGQNSLREEEALTALYMAVNETRIYMGSFGGYMIGVASRKDRKKRDRETEEKLARLWTAASIKLRPVNMDLADRCFLKGDYWANPDIWSEQEIRKARIEIDRVFKEARALL